MASSTKHVATFFQSASPAVLIKRPTHARKVMEWVMDADYSRLKSCWKDTPELMMEPVSISTPAGNILMSPLQKAFELYDTYTWMGFYETIRRNIDLQNKFFEQAEQQQEQQTFLSLDMFFKAYEDLFELLQQPLEPGTDVSEWDEYEVRYLIKQRTQALQVCLGKLAKKQGTELPMHMIKELYRPDEENWKKKSTFDIKDFTPPAGKISQQSIRGSLANRQIMIRGCGEAELVDIDKLFELHQCLPPLHASLLERDYKIFKQLFEKRKEQFDSQFEQIKPAMSCP